MNKIRIEFIVWFSILLMVFDLVFYFFSLGRASNFLNFLGLGVLGVSALLVVKGRGGWIFVLYSFGLTFALLSGALIELMEVPLIEVAEIAYLTGATARNSFLASIFLLFMYLCYRFLSVVVPARIGKIGGLEPIASKIVLYFSYFSPLYVAITMMIYGSPLTLGVDRFDYFKDIAPPGYAWVYGNVPVLGYFVALSVYKQYIKKNTAILWFLLTVVIYFLAGEKFSKIFLLGFFFFLPYFVIDSPVVKNKHLVVAVFATLSMTVLVIINYTLIYGSAEMLLPRLALQGQMNYALDGISFVSQPLNVTAEHLLGFGGEGGDNGLKYLMYLVAPFEIVNARIDQGAAFTTPFPSNLSFFFGFFYSPICVMFLSAAVGGAAVLLFKATEGLNVIFSGLVIKVFFLVYLAVTMGELYLLFELKTLFLLFFVFVFLIIGASRSKSCV